jgi:cyclohexanecarboxylate-CoA ligase
MALQKTLATTRDRQMREQGWWRDTTINACFKQVLQRHPDKIALVAYTSHDGRSREFTFRELDRLIAKAAVGLTRMGVGAGDVVSIQLPNIWEFIVASMATARIGAVINPIMPILRERELSYILEFCEAKVFIVPSVYRGHDFAAMALELKHGLPSLQHVVVAGGEGLGAFEEALLGCSERDAAEWETSDGKLDPDDVAVLMFSSGTTGSPKGVMHTSNTVLSSLFNAIDDMALSGEEVVLAASPVGHMLGYAHQVLMPTMLGASIVMLDLWNPRVALRLMREQGVTFSTASPPFLADLVNAVEEGEPTPERFRLLGCAGAPIPAVLVERASSRMHVAVCSIWGMTEILFGTLTEPAKALELSARSDGRASRGSEVKILDYAGNPVPMGTRGRLLFRGCSLFVGYLKRPDLSVLDAGGWFDTGDLAYQLNDEGYIRIDGRTKDIIVRGGENVPVVEIESLLLRHPAVMEVAIVGYPDERLGERACACVVTRDGHSFDLTELARYLQQTKTAKHYWPERLIVCREMPRTASGKIQKFKLKEMVREDDQ